jgi:hypothetical protein
MACLPPATCSLLAWALQQGVWCRPHHPHDGRPQARRDGGPATHPEPVAFQSVVDDRGASTTTPAPLMCCYSYSYSYSYRPGVGAGALHWGCALFPAWELILFLGKKKNFFSEHGGAQETSICWSGWGAATCAWHCTERASPSGLHDAARPAVDCVLQGVPRHHAAAAGGREAAPAGAPRRSEHW